MQPGYINGGPATALVECNPPPKYGNNMANYYYRNPSKTLKGLDKDSKIISLFGMACYYFIQHSFSDAKYKAYPHQNTNCF